MGQSLEPLLTGGLLYLLHILSSDGLSTGHPLSVTPLRVGRAHSNDLRIVDPSVSARHLEIWDEGGRVSVEDLGSRNGVFVDGERVQGRAVIAPGQELGIGPRVVARISKVNTEAGSSRPPLRAVEHPKTGLQYPLHMDRMRLGSSPSCDIPVEGTADQQVTLIIHQDGHVQLGVGEILVDLKLGQTFVVGGEEFVLRELDASVEQTATALAERSGVEIDVRVSGTPVARVTDPSTGLSTTITADNRVVLLYLLATHATQETRRGPPGVGWIHEEDVITGVWGRVTSSSRLNNLNVLVCRTRKQLRAAGIDPWFIERRSHHLRIRAVRVSSEP